jgi:uncharacterized protein RhaS with RHS repeats
MIVACHFCGARISPDAPGTYRRVTGWEKVRTQGGANAVTLRTETGEVACAACIGAVRNGVDPRSQGSML